MKNFLLLFFIILFLFMIEIFLWIKNFFLVILSFFIVIFLTFLYLSRMTEDLKTFKKLVSLFFKNIDTIFLIVLKNFYFFTYLILKRNTEDDIIEKKINLEKNDQIFNHFLKLIFFMDITILNLYFTEKSLNIKIKRDFDSEIYQTRYYRMLRKL
ncbi:MAG: hypothetical protein WHT27_01135 [candidate division WOR-3 bacterium]